MDYPNSKEAVPKDRQNELKLLELLRALDRFFIGGLTKARNPSLFRRLPIRPTRLGFSAPYFCFCAGWVVRLVRVWLVTTK